MLNSWVLKIQCLLVNGIRINSFLAQNKWPGWKTKNMARRSIMPWQWWVLRRPEREQEYLLKGLASGGSPIQKTESFISWHHCIMKMKTTWELKNIMIVRFMRWVKRSSKKEVERLVLRFTDIAKNINIIEIQDSLLQVSLLTEQKQWAKKILKKRKAICFEIEFTRTCYAGPNRV